MSDLKALYKEAFGAFARGDYDEAIAAYHRVIEADASFGLAYQGLAEAHSRKGELDQAIEAIHRAIAVDPDESLYHTSLSRFLQMQGKIPEAEEAAANAMKLQSRQPL
jgi:tetratricopeptide (TPR) repeat protein